MQELQRLQEEQTGKKRSEKMEWMYATPATGGSANPNDLEDYLLGKKRVDKILTGDENAKVRPSLMYDKTVSFTPPNVQVGAAHKNFIAVQNANSARDTAAKIRDDPLLAIKQQEQAAYQALLSNPLRLKAMKEKAGIKDQEKDKKKHKHRHRHGSDEWERPRSRSRERADEFPSRRSRRATESHSYRSRSRSRTRSLTPPRHRSRDVRSIRRSASPLRRYDDGRDHDGPGRGGRDDRAHRTQRTPSPSSRRGERDYRSSAGPSGSYQRRHSPERRPERNSNSRSEDRGRDQDRNPRSQAPPGAASSSASAEDRARRLAQMTSDADELNSSRATRLAALKAAEEAERTIEDEKRKTASKNGVQGDFMRAQNKLVYGGSIGLEERLKRGRGALVRESD